MLFHKKFFFMLSNRHQTGGIMSVNPGSRILAALLILMFSIPSIGWTAPDTYRPKSIRKEQTAAILDFRQCVPVYPAQSERDEEQGDTIVQLIIAPSGQVLSSSVSHSSGHERLDHAAQEGLSRCKFRPATLDGRPVQSLQMIRYAWRLD